MPLTSSRLVCRIRRRGPRALLWILSHSSSSCSFSQRILCSTWLKSSLSSAACPYPLSHPSALTTHIARHFHPTQRARTPWYARVPILSCHPPQELCCPVVSSLKYFFLAMGWIWISQPHFASNHSLWRGRGCPMHYTIWNSADATSPFSGGNQNNLWTL